jgi:hypothetical protein
MNRAMTAAAVIGAVLAAHSRTPAHANPVPFTWDPSLAVPALVAGPAAFTADSALWTNYNRTVNVNDLVTLKQTVTADQYQTIAGFTRAGAPVTAPGLNSAYGLYFHINSVFSFPLSPGGVIVGPPTFTSLVVSLLADVNHDDGVMSTSASGIGFSNAAGVMNDVTLASGSLISATLTGIPGGVRHSHFVTTFVPTAGEENFFVGPDGAPGLISFGDSLPGAFSVVPVDSQTFLTLVNGDLGSQGMSQFAPEPASIGVLAMGLFGLCYARRRRNRC